ncbi:MAG: acetyl ornithine aminotransferase family protein [Candidatus Micrarchaeia archaeon]
MIKIDRKITDIIKRDRKVIMTTTRESYPFVPDHGDGDFIYDISGNKFIDFSSFISVYNFGVNANKEVREAIKKQVDKLMHPAFTDYYGELPVKFAEKFVKMFPSGFGKVFFSNSGTEANEAAMKFARIFTKRTYILAFYNSFHGRTLGSLGMTASKVVQREYFGPFANIVHAPFPYPYRCPFDHEQFECGMDYINFIENYIFRKEVSPEEIAAVFIEPVQGEGGYIVPPKKFITELRKITSEHGILLIDDEVQAGNFRTGKFLALDNFGVSADIYTMAKSVGAGIPIGLTVSRNSLGSIPAGAHANTFGGNLVAVSAANALLDYVTRNKARIERGVKAKGAYAMKRLNEMKDKYEIIGDVRGIGLMIGVEIVKDKKSKAPGIKEREKILTDSFYNGLILLPAGESSIRIIPPLTVADENLRKGLDIFENAVKKANSDKAV